MSRFTHFFRRFFVTEKQTPQTFSLLECMHMWAQMQTCNFSFCNLHMMHAECSASNFKSLQLKFGLLCVKHLILWRHIFCEMNLTIGQRLVTTSWLCLCVGWLVGQLFRVVRIYVPKLGAVHHLCVTKPHPPSGHSLARSAAQHITLQYRKQLSELRRLPYLGETWHLWPQHRWHERDTRANQRPSTPPVSAFPLQIEICAHNDTHNDTHTDTQWHRHKL